MLKIFYFLTIFPEIIHSYINKSIPKLAQKKNKVKINILNIRKNNKTQIDDFVYGGGGMCLKIDTIFDLLKEFNLLNEHIILLSPQGKTFTQKKAQNLSKINKKIIFICGHYEGVDERINNYISEKISIGDYVVSSGEISSLVVADAIIRLIPGVINEQSLISESFDNNLLDHPVYTRPYEFEGYKVPDILLSGNHQKIKEYRENEKIKITKKMRPDLYKKYLKKK